ncbi:hypothetical protein BDR22DRAFT_817347 [Usnea florida]
MPRAAIEVRDTEHGKIVVVGGQELTGAFQAPVKKAKMEEVKTTPTKAIVSPVPVASEGQAVSHTPTISPKPITQTPTKVASPLDDWAGTPSPSKPTSRPSLRDQLRKPNADKRLEDQLLQANKAIEDLTKANTDLAQQNAALEK